MYLFSKSTFYTQLYNAGAGILRTTLCFDGCFLKFPSVQGPRKGLQNCRRNKRFAPFWACLGFQLVCSCFVSCFVCYTLQCHLSTISYLAAAASRRSRWFPVFSLFSRVNLTKLPEVSEPHCRPESLPQKSDLQLHSHSLRIQGKYCRSTVAF